MDRNHAADISARREAVALRKESVDRNFLCVVSLNYKEVALRKESVDRNIFSLPLVLISLKVALRKESVDRNCTMQIVIIVVDASLSARRAWIEILLVYLALIRYLSRSPQGERG